MPKKHKQEEPALGTDSFLDVLCNMVGILVILIVIAGLRAAKKPVVLPEIVPPVVALAEKTDVPTETVELGTPITFPMRDPEPPPAAPDVKVAPPTPPVELVEEAERLRSELAAVRKSVTQAEKSAKQAAAPRQPINVDELELALQQDLLALQNEAQVRQARQIELNDLRKAVEKARVQLDAMEGSKPPPKVLQHRLAPLARVVSTKEVHFRLSGGKVSIVPIDALVESLQSSLQRQRDFIMSRDRYASTVGPIDGYRMEYAIQRHKGGNISDELKYGQTMIRMVVSGWVIRPDGEVPGETAEEALRPGSRFQQAVRDGGSLATLTFWIYPDTFDLYRQLQDFAYQRDLNVAARPLPEGVPIAGSPSGSKSMAQ